MAEVLLKGKNSPSRAWRRGDPVTVQADGFVWSYNETRAAWIASGRRAAEWPAEFYLLRVPGVSVARLTQYLVEWADTLDLGPRRLWRCLIDEIPLAIRDILTSTGMLTIGVDVTRAQVEARFRRKDTEAVADLS